MMRLEDVMRASRRYEVILKVEQGVMRMVEAAGLLSLTVRQLRRLRRRKESGGLKALLYQREHGGCNQVSEEERDQVLKLRGEIYRKYNILHFRDVLRERHGIRRSREFYRRLFLVEKLYTPVLRRRQRKHRKRFEAPQAGVLIQRDTSIHFWIPGAARPWKLILDLDDHSRKITGAYFSLRDDVLSNMLVAWETISTHGLPVAYYMDNNPIFNPIRHQPRHYQFFRHRKIEGKETLPQFKRALKELGITCIHSTPYQPQGKGKIERIFRFMQDRLVNEMITAGVTTIDEANKYLKKWVDWYNHQHLHSVTRQIPDERCSAHNAFKKVPQKIDLNEVFCLKYERKVKADNTFSLEGRTYQIQPNRYRLSYTHAKVEVRVYLNKKIRVLYKNQAIGTFKMKPNIINRLETGADILALY